MPSSDTLANASSMSCEEERKQRQGGGHVCHVALWGTLSQPSLSLQETC